MSRPLRAGASYVSQQDRGNRNASYNPSYTYSPDRSNDIGFDEVIRQEVRLLFAIQDYCKQHPQLDYLMSNIVSKHPLKDIVLLLYLFFVFGLVEVGHNHFWICIMNLACAFLVRKLIQAKRPVEYNRALRPTADLSVDSYAYPSLESHMSVVIMCHIHRHFGWTIWFAPVVFAVVGLIGFSRLYARSRFLHQVVLSWVSGVAGFMISLSLCNRFNFDRMVRRNYITLLYISIGGLLCNFALGAESNESRLIMIPKREFIRVITEIINPPKQDEETQLQDEEGEEDDLDDDGSYSNRMRYADPSQEPSGAAAPPVEPLLTATELRRKRVRESRRDSFFFLQRSLEQRGKSAVYARSPRTNQMEAKLDKMA